MGAGAEAIRVGGMGGVFGIEGSSDWTVAHSVVRIWENGMCFGLGNGIEDVCDTVWSDEQPHLTSYTSDSTFNSCFSLDSIFNSSSDKGSA